MVRPCSAKEMGLRCSVAHDLTCVANLPRIRLTAQYSIAPHKRRMTGYPTTMRHLGDRIRQLRLDCGLTQRQLAQELGVGYSTLNRWELGQSEPRFARLKSVRGFLAGQADGSARVGLGAKT